MNETNLTPGSMAFQLNQLYKEEIDEQVEINGTTTFKIGQLDPLKHDFVNPSYSMLLPDSKNGNFLGNYINEKANHVSGGDINTNNQYSYKLIKKILKKMC